MLFFVLATAEVLSKSLVIIPTYNEKENIAKIIEAVFSLKRSFHLLIVDDNSPDGTADIVKELQNLEDPLAINNLNLSKILLIKKEKMGNELTYTTSQTLINPPSFHRS